MPDRSTAFPAEEERPAWSLRLRAWLVGAGLLLALPGAALAAQDAPGAPPKAAAATYDLVFRNVRAMDPETGLDATRDIGVQGGRIAAISQEPLHGRVDIDGRGLVAAPGFIDLHSHAVTERSATFQAMDGVTTRLELELGVYPVKAWYDKKAGRELINYGASVSHALVRYHVEHPEEPPFADTEAHTGLAGPAYTSDAILKPMSPEASSRFIDALDEGLRDGALGIGSGTQYVPGITHQEMLDLTRLAAKRGACVFTHIRYGSLIEPGSTLEAVQEQIANAAVTGACIHIVHINSMAMGQTMDMIGLFHQARNRGLDISTEIYPWTAAVSRVRNVLLDPGWEARWGNVVGDLQSMATGKRLTQADFDALRAGTGDDRVLQFQNSDQTIIDAIRDPMVLVASDSLDVTDRFGHPRSAGSFARVLGHYVRETKAISLMDALRKMSLMPAQRLEAFVPAMKHKGRLQVGADADLVLFDPNTVRAGADYLDAAEYSIGIDYVTVNGKLVVKGGKLVPGVHPGAPIFNKFVSK